MVRVLVVEDCRTLADLVAEGLSDQGIATDLAYDGTAAADKVGVNSDDVEVLDTTLPGVPGDALCQMISCYNERCLVLVLSGAASPAERTSGLGPRRRRLPREAGPLPRTGHEGPCPRAAPTSWSASGPASWRDRARLSVPHRPPPGSAARSLGKRAGPFGGPHDGLSRLPERRAALGESLGRERQPLLPRPWRSRSVGFGASSVILR
jgi:CheY-like chemotaxis protein